MLIANHISIPLGIIIGLLASFVQSLGLTIQRKSHVLNQSLPNHRQRVEHKRPLWLLGFAIFISSNLIGSFVQIASLPVVILAPLGAVSLLWNAFFARLLLGDVFSPWMILGTILIAGGAVLIAFFGIVPEQTRSLEDLLALFRRPTFIVYFSILGFIVFVCLAITHLMEFSLSRRLEKNYPSDDSPPDLSPPARAVHLSTHSTNLASGLSNTPNNPLIPSEETPLIDPKFGTILSPPLRSVDRTRLLLAVSYASFSGIISGMCLLFAKSGVELLLLTIGGNNQFWRWEAWVLLLGLVVFALLQLWYLHKALILVDPTLVCPSAFCFYNVSSILNGLVYFDQFSLIPLLHLGLVTLGVVVLLAGVWVVSIQAGGGGVDVGTWNEETIKLSGDDVALYSEPEVGEDEGGPSDAVAMTHQPGSSQTRPHTVPVTADRETRSEPSLPTISSPPLDMAPTEGSPSTHLPSGNRQRAETQLYPTPRKPSYHVRRAPSTDMSGTLPSSGLRTVSYPYSPHSNTPHSPPLGPVSSLGPGFQIGLSPLSPGFTIMPIERRRPQGPSLAEVANDIVGHIHERRRPASEGDATRRISNDYEVENANPLPSRGEDVPTRGHGRERWRWLKNILSNKD